MLSTAAVPLARPWAHTPTATLEGDALVVRTRALRRLTSYQVQFQAAGSSQSRSPKATVSGTVILWPSLNGSTASSVSSKPLALAKLRKATMASRAGIFQPCEVIGTAKVDGKVVASAEVLCAEREA